MCPFYWSTSTPEFHHFWHIFGWLRNNVCWQTIEIEVWNILTYELTRWNVPLPVLNERLPILSDLSICSMPNSDFCYTECQRVDASFV